VSAVSLSLCLVAFRLFGLRLLLLLRHLRLVKCVLRLTENGAPGLPSSASAVHIWARAVYWALLLASSVVAASRRHSAASLRYS